MDTLSLRKYRIQVSTADKHSASLSQLPKSKRLLKSNNTSTNDGLVKLEKEFLEFFVNDKPLSVLLDNFYGTKGSILDNWIGVLGSTVNKRTEILKVKQLIGKIISDKEIRQVYPSEWNDTEFQWYLENIRQELADPEVIIYCCTECGDYDCGGIKAKIDKTDTAFVWTITEKNEILKFEFDKSQYFDLFDKYLRQLTNKG